MLQSAERTAQPDAEPASPWADATLAAALLAVDPAGLGGGVLRGPAGPVRDQWLILLRQLLRPDAPVRKIPVHVKEDRLLGGLDLAATLRSGRPVTQKGLLAEAHGGIVVLAMAERVTPYTAAQVAAAMDLGEVVAERDGVALRSLARFGVVALDEGLPDDERVPASLADRLSLLIDLTDIGLRDVFDGSMQVEPPEQEAIDRVEQARQRLPGVQVGTESIGALCAAAWALGIRSARIPLLAVRVARASAALDGRLSVEQQDAIIAARLVLAPRASVTQGPGAEQAESNPHDEPDNPSDSQDPSGNQPPDDPQTSDDDSAQSPSAERTDPLKDVVLQAARAAIPAGLLARLKIRDRAGASRQSAGRAGSLQRGRRRGRPAGTRRGEPTAGARISIVDTLRAAAPWQHLRREGPASTPSPGSNGPPSAQPVRLVIRPEDMRVKCYQQHSETTTLFVVDASGSSALNRLAEAKGAVELLLADCYVRRDRVAVMAFRGAAADLLLPPTRSLVRAKRSLAGLPGGGGTPLATAITQAALLADSIQRKGDTPLVVLLTDGRANVGLDGSPGRSGAESDAQTAARQMRGRGHAAMLIDTSAKPGEQARRLAQEMGAIYLFLPHAGAASISQAIKLAGLQASQAR